MKRSIFTGFILIFVSLTGFNCNGQSSVQLFENARLVGGPCEGCEAVFEFGKKSLSSVDTLYGFNRPVTKLKINGQVFKNDGKSPAENVIVYIYQTNSKGIYETMGDEIDWTRRHGLFRGWIKTDKNGAFTFYTIKPGTYPNRLQSAHIHFIILEPKGKYYWISDINFAGDSLLTQKELHPDAPRAGGPVVLKLHQTYLPAFFKVLSPT